MTTDGQELLTVPEAAKRFGISTDKIRVWMRRGKRGQRKLPRFKAGDGTIYVDARDVERLMHIQPDDPA